MARPSRDIISLALHSLSLSARKTPPAAIRVSTSCSIKLERAESCSSDWQQHYCSSCSSDWQQHYCSSCSSDWQQLQQRLAAVAAAIGSSIISHCLKITSSCENMQGIPMQLQQQALRRIRTTTFSWQGSLEKLASLFHSTEWRRSFTARSYT